jgi:hypothetical protein
VLFYIRTLNTPKCWKNSFLNHSFLSLNYFYIHRNFIILSRANDMMLSKSTFALTGLLACHTCIALSVPSNIQSLYNSIVATGSCRNILQTGLEAENGGPKSKGSPLFPIIRTNSVQLSLTVVTTSTTME